MWRRDMADIYAKGEIAPHLFKLEQCALLWDENAVLYSV